MEVLYPVQKAVVGKDVTLSEIGLKPKIDTVKVRDVSGIPIHIATEASDTYLLALQYGYAGKDMAKIAIDASYREYDSLIGIKADHQMPSGASKQALGQKPDHGSGFPRALEKLVEYARAHNNKDATNSNRLMRIHGTDSTISKPFMEFLEDSLLPWIDAWNAVELADITRVAKNILWTDPTQIHQQMRMLMQARGESVPLVIDGLEASIDKTRLRELWMANLHKLFSKKAIRRNKYPKDTDGLIAKARVLAEATPQDLAPLLEQFMRTCSEQEQRTIAAHALADLEGTDIINPVSEAANAFLANPQKTRTRYSIDHLGSGVYKISDSRTHSGVYFGYDQKREKTKFLPNPDGAQNGALSPVMAVERNRQTHTARFLRQAEVISILDQLNIRLPGNPDVALGNVIWGQSSPATTKLFPVVMTLDEGNYEQLMSAAQLPVQYKITENEAQLVSLENETTGMFQSGIMAAANNW